MNAHALPVIFNFFCVVAIVVYFGRKPFAAFFAGRSERIEKAVADASAAKAQADAELAQWTAAVRQESSIKTSGETAARAAMERYREKTLAAARQEAERIVGDGRRLVQFEQEAARRRLRSELATRSLELSAEYFRDSLDAKERHKLVADFVESFGNGKA